MLQPHYNHALSLMGICSPCTPSKWDNLILSHFLHFSDMAQAYESFYWCVKTFFFFNVDLLHIDRSFYSDYNQILPPLFLWASGACGHDPFPPSSLRFTVAYLFTKPFVLFSFFFLFSYHNYLVLPLQSQHMHLTKQSHNRYSTTMVGTK